jgi:hypothetical protein
MLPSWPAAAEAAEAAALPVAWAAQTALLVVVLVQPCTALLLGPGEHMLPLATLHCRCLQTLQCWMAQSWMVQSWMVQ